jgi:D-serine deaminase-like pyridoxal phosphate-dependent protein
MSRHSSGEAWKRPWLDASDQLRHDYAGHIGRPLAELPTPALVVDLDILERNVAVMNAALDGQVAKLRPHTKVQKSPDLAKLQLDAGAIGVTVASVWEAAAMAASGVEDILIANEVVGPAKVTALAQLAGHASLTVAVDDLTNIADISAALTAAGTTASALIDLDVGMARCGARSPEQAVELARAVAAAPGLTLRGVQAYEGHCMHEPDRATRQRMAREAMDYAAGVKKMFADDGHDAPTLSGGGTGTYDITGTNPEVTELQAGSFVFMDAFHGNLVPGFEISLHVHTSVMVRHGDTVILDAGRKSIGIDFVLPPIVGFDYEARYYAEEHALFDVAPDFVAAIGDRFRLVSGYAPTTVNLHDVMFVAKGDEIVDTWPVFPRGPSHHGFIGALAADGLAAGASAADD